MSANVKLEIEAPESVPAGSALEVVLKLTNESDEAITYESKRGFADFWVWVQDLGTKDHVPYTRDGWANCGPVRSDIIYGGRGFVTIQPGKSITHKLLVSRFFSVGGSGNYQIHVNIYPAIGDIPNHGAVSRWENVAVILGN